MIATHLDREFQNRYSCNYTFDRLSLKRIPIFLVVHSIAYTFVLWDKDLSLLIELDLVPRDSLGKNSENLVAWRGQSLFKICGCLPSCCLSPSTRYSTTHKFCVHRSNYTKSHLSAYIKSKSDPSKQCL